MQNTDRDLQFFPAHLIDVTMTGKGPNVTHSTGGIYPDLPELQSLLGYLGDGNGFLAYAAEHLCSEAADFIG